MTRQARFIAVYSLTATLLLAACSGTDAQPAEQPPAPAQTSIAQQPTEAPTVPPAATAPPQLAATLTLPPAAVTIELPTEMPSAAQLPPTPAASSGQAQTGPPAAAPSNHLISDDPELVACLLRALGQEVYDDLRASSGMPSQQQMMAMGPCMAVLSPGGGPPSGAGEMATAPVSEPTAAPDTLTCEDARYTFTDIGLVLTALQVGNSDPMAPMANPSSLLLSDGRVRLFFTNAGAGIGSAISTDGLSFVYEGMRIDGREARSQGADLGPLRVYRLPDGRVRLFVGSSQTGVQSFVSSDEFASFSIEPGERITQAAADMSAIQKLSIIPLPDGRWRGYFGPAPQHGAEGDEPSQRGPPDHWLRSAVSTDLFEWSVEPGVLIGPGAPHMTASVREVFPLLRDDGCVTLFYQLNNPQDAGIYDFTGVAVIGYSTSIDGLTFRKQFTLINVRDPAGPDVLRMPDGTFLMYHDSTDYAGYGHGIRVGRLQFSAP